MPLLAVFMKSVVLLTVLALANTCAAGGSVEIRTIKSGAHASANPAEPRAAAAFDESRYHMLWSATIGDGEAPAVDFATESVVFLLAGEKPTGGWTVEPRAAVVEGETLVVDAAIKPPPPDSMVTQAFTSPYAVIAVKSKAFKDVRWKR